MTRQGWSPARRDVLRLALGAGLGFCAAGRVDAQDAGARRARPQPNDRFVFAGGLRKNELVTLADLPPDGPPAVTYPMDPATKIVRDESRLNQVLLVRLDPSRLNSDTRARAAEGIVGYSAVCTHTGCDAWDWQRSIMGPRCSKIPRYAFPLTGNRGRRWQATCPPACRGADHLTRCLRPFRVDRTHEGLQGCRCRRPE